MTRWVQHHSGKGEKWEVHDEITAAWLVKRKIPDAHQWRYFELPQSEYLPCDPPEEYEDVTGGCSIISNLIYHQGVSICWNPDYRVRGAEVNLVGPGIPQWAFIVERLKL